MSIYLTGSTGFVGKSVINSFAFQKIMKYKRGEDIFLDGSTALIHLAGKAHDLMNTSLSDDYYQINTEFTKKIFNPLVLILVDIPLIYNMHLGTLKT